MSDIHFSMCLVPGIAGENKFGRNIDVASGGTEPIWDGSGAYTWPATALMTHISQTADQAALRGATIEVSGLDADWILTKQLVVLNASLTTTAVELDTPLIRVFRMHVLANVVIDSTVRVHNAAENTDYAVISVGNNQTLMALYTIPAGKTGYMTQYYASLNTAAAIGPTSLIISLWERDNKNGYAPQIKHAHGLDPDASSAPPPHTFDPYREIKEKTDIWITAHSVGKAADVSAGFDLYLKDD